MDITFADLLPFIAIGFAAQLVDGALGMAFGAISSTLLISLGVQPRAASASVHLVECFTTGASGISHLLYRNVDGRLFARLVVPGMIGGVVGAYLLSNISAKVAQPFVLTYLALIGCYLIWRGSGHPPHERDPRLIAPIGLVGGFLDAAGGGGWGAVVSGNLLIQGASPRKVVGTVNAAEFFLTLTISITFITQIGMEAFTEATIGLLIGGVLAAPLGAYFAKRLKSQRLLILVGLVLVLTSGWGIYRTL